MVQQFTGSSETQIARWITALEKLKDRNSDDLATVSSIDQIIIFLEEQQREIQNTNLSDDGGTTRF